MTHQDDGNAPVPGDRHEAELRQFREAVNDLESQIRDLDAQLAAMSRARGQGQTEDSESAGTPPVVVTGPPPAAGTSALLKRTAKRAIRGTLGVARMVWGAADPAQRHVVAVLPAQDRTTELPRLTVVVEADEIPEQLVRQTIEELEVALWDRIEGTFVVLTLDGVEARRSTARSRDEMLELVSGDYLMWLPSGSPELPVTLLETLQWLVASEHPLFVRIPVPNFDQGEDNHTRIMILASRDVWIPDGGVDLERLADAAKSRPMVGKTVGLGGDMDVAVPRLGSLGSGSHGVVCRTGRYDVWAGNTAGPVEHRVSQLPPCPEPDEALPADSPVVMVVAAESLTAGVDTLVAGVVGALIEHADPVVVTTSAQSALDLRRVAQLDGFDVPVYELGSTLDPSVWPSALGWVVSRYGVDRIVTVGRDDRIDGAVSEIIDRGIGVVRLPADGGSIPRGWPVTANQQSVPEVRRRATRSELGVGEDRHLIVVAADLVPAGRLEDVVAVAQELRGQRETVFVVVGEGPLAGHLLDLVRYLDLDNVWLRPPIHHIGELAAAADLVLDVSEGAAVRPMVVAALAAGTPVVATPGAGIEGLLESTGGVGRVVGSAGDPGEIANAIRRARTAVGEPPDLAEVRQEILGLKTKGIDELRAAVLDLDPSATGD